MLVDDVITVLDAFFTFCNRWNRFPVIWLTGGEPTLHPHFWDILDTITNDCRVAVLSNGTTITPAFVEKLCSLPVNPAVQISVDGTAAETHDAIRGRGSFSKAVNALRLLHSAAIETHMHFVVSKKNYNDGFLITDLACDVGVDVLTVTRLVPWEGALFENMLTPKQVYTLFKKLSDDADKISLLNPPKPFIARDRCDWPIIYPDPTKKEAFTKNGSCCSAARSYINVMHTGDVYPCRRLPVTVGNLFKDDLMQIWQHPFLWKLREKHKYMQGKCQTCYFNVCAPHVCSGGATCIAYAWVNDPFQPDPQCSINVPAPGG
jgi:radical SAM protein with 4Fe4S-binding SPASM domain